MVRPTRISSPSRSRSWPVSRRPLRRVPLRDPTSRSSQVVPTRSRRAWTLETVGSLMGTATDSTSDPSVSAAPSSVTTRRDHVPSAISNRAIAPSPRDNCHQFRTACASGRRPSSSIAWSPSNAVRGAVTMGARTGRSVCTPMAGGPRRRFDRRHPRPQEVRCASHRSGRAAAAAITSIAGATARGGVPIGTCAADLARGAGGRWRGVCVRRLRRRGHP